MDVVLASCQKIPEPDPDESLLLDSLARAGIEAEVAAWDDPGVDWTRAPLTVMRSTWNYPWHFAEFLAWAKHVAARSELWNPLPVVHANTHKGYLLELERRGIPVAPTELVARGTKVALTDVLAKRGWQDVVIKPAVSAGSYRTLRSRSGEDGRAGPHFLDLLRDGDALVQRYVPSVEDYGERALVWIDGVLTHAVRKEPRFQGDDESVSTSAVPITAAEARLAERVIATIDAPLLYARIDVAPDEEGRPLLLELELVEPSLFLLQSPSALDRFVSAIRARLER